MAEPAKHQDLKEIEREARASLRENTNRWNLSLESLSVQLAYAVIAANWAVHSNSLLIQGNCFALASIGTAVGFLVLNVILLGINTQIMWNTKYTADHTEDWWDSEAKRKFDDPSYPFPFPNVSGQLSKCLRWLRLVVPGIAGTLFVLSLLSRAV